MDIEPIVQSALAWQPIHEMVTGLAEEQDHTFGDVLNAVAVELAKRFLAGAVDFTVADGASDQLFAAMLERSHKTDDGDASFPDLAYAIFGAFDEGEHRHPGDDERDDPVELYTIPQLRSALESIT